MPALALHALLGMERDGTLRRSNAARNARRFVSHFFRLEHAENLLRIPLLGCSSPRSGSRSEQATAKLGGIGRELECLA